MNGSLTYEAGSDACCLHKLLRHYFRLNLLTSSAITFALTKGASMPLSLTLPSVLIVHAYVVAPSSKTEATMTLLSKANVQR